MENLRRKIMPPFLILPAKLWFVGEGAVSELSFRSIRITEEIGDVGNDSGSWKHSIFTPNHYRVDNNGKIQNHSPSLDQYLTSVCMCFLINLHPFPFIHLPPYIMDRVLFKISGTI